MNRLPSESFTEILSEQETYVSALIDGESVLSAEGQMGEATITHQYYHYQLIRQTLRGVAMTTGAHETVSWHQCRFAQLWARVDAMEVDVPGGQTS